MMVGTSRIMVVGRARGRRRDSNQGSIEWSDPRVAKRASAAMSERPDSAQLTPSAGRGQIAREQARVTLTVPSDRSETRRPGDVAGALWYSPDEESDVARSSSALSEAGTGRDGVRTKFDGSQNFGFSCLAHGSDPSGEVR